MTQTQRSPFYVADKRRGDATKQYTHYYDAHLMQAAGEIAKELGNEYGLRLSPATLLANLATQRGRLFRDIRRQLDTRTKQLKKEHRRNVKAITTPHDPTSEAIRQEHI